MNTYWLVGHKNYSVQNDSLVCHWNPNLARKKKPVANSRGSVANVGIITLTHTYTNTITQLISSR